VSGVRRTLLAVTISLVMVATAVASLWLMASAGVFSTGDTALPHAAAGVVDDAVTPATVGGPVGEARLVQPRDPFRPLIDPTTTQPEEPGDTSTTLAGDTSTTQPGDTSTTEPGDTSTTEPGETTTTVGDEPQGTRVVLLEVRDDDGVFTAVLTVDGETYTAAVGETFAEQFKVISLDADGGVFTYGDSAFSLAVGQAILK
jgi:hypothetical protein